MSVTHRVPLNGHNNFLLNDNSIDDLGREHNHLRGHRVTFTFCRAACFSSQSNPFCVSIAEIIQQVGSMLGPSWLQLGSSWAYVGPVSGSIGTTQALPNPFHMASGPPRPPLAPYKIQNETQKGFPNLQLGP